MSSAIKADYLRTSGAHSSHMAQGPIFLTALGWKQVAGREGGKPSNPVLWQPRAEWEEGVQRMVPESERLL